MNVFHLCHHKHCIIHVIYEFADFNQDRLQCFKKIKFLRKKKKFVLN